MKRVFLVVLLTAVIVFALGASMQQLRADEAENCVSYDCNEGGTNYCTHIPGVKCDLCNPYDKRCALKTEPDAE